MQLHVGGMITEQLIDLLSIASNQPQTPKPTQHVQVPDNSFRPCQMLKDSIQANINPLASFADFGKSLYNQMVQLVGTHLSPSCNNCD